MKSTNISTEEILAMYRETVSPSRDSLRSILSQIPEQQQSKERRAVRSPYRWLVTSQVVSLAALLLFVYPLYNTTKISAPDYYFLTTDSQVQAFESSIDQEDYKATFN